jgi:hypothetical protein
MTAKALAKKIRCAQSSMSDALAPTAKHSTLVPAIHRALGWDPPPRLAAPTNDPVPIPSADALEMAGMFDRLPENVKQALRDQAKAYLELLEAKTR